MYEYKRRVTREWHFWLNNSRAFTGRYALLSAVFVSRFCWLASSSSRKHLSYFWLPTTAGAPDALARLIGSIFQYPGQQLLVKSCSCPQGKCRLSVGGCFALSCVPQTSANSNHRSGTTSMEMWASVHNLTSIRMCKRSV